MALVAQIERGARVSNARSASRRKLSLPTQGSTAAQLFATVVIHDLSESGLLIETNEKLATDERVEIQIPEAGPVPATVVWSSGRYFGCRFDERLSRGAVSAAILRNAVPARVAEGETITAVVPREDEERNDDTGKLSVAARMWVLVILGVASWGVLALIIWAAVAAGDLA